MNVVKFFARLADWFRPKPVKIVEKLALIETIEPAIEITTESPPEPPRERQKSLRGLRREIYEAVTEIIELFNSSERENLNLKTGTYINAHDDLWACDYHFIDMLAERMDGASRWFLRVEEQREQADAVWPVDIGTVVWKDHSEGYYVGRVATVAPSELRGKVKIVPTKAVTISGGYLIKGKKWWAETSICGLVGKNWTCIENALIRQSQSGVKGNTNQIFRGRADPQELNDSISMTLAIAMTERYSWHVAFGKTDGPRLLLPTSPTGCLALFRDREKSESGRRDALKHWVTNHYRDSSHSKADIIYVCDHLRGATTFVWRGLKCEILVSQYDLEKNEFFRVQAAEWRSQRKHNRIRLRIKDRKHA